MFFTSFVFILTSIYLFATILIFVLISFIHTDCVVRIDQGNYVRCYKAKSSRLSRHLLCSGTFLIIIIFFCFIKLYINLICVVSIDMKLSVFVYMCVYVYGQVFKVLVLIELFRFVQVFGKSVRPALSTPRLCDSALGEEVPIDFRFMYVVMFSLLSI